MQPFLSSQCSLCSAKHSPLECGFRKSLYCYICSIYGHSPTICPNERAKAIRQGKRPSLENRELCVLDTDEAIQILLSQYSLEPLGSQKANRAALINLANSFTPPYMVTFISSKKKKDEAKEDKKDEKDKEDV